MRPHFLQIVLQNPSTTTLSPILSPATASRLSTVIGTASAVFVFDPEPVQNEIANVNTAWEKYNNDLLTGAIDPETTVPTIIDELNAAGLQTVIDEAQKQLDAFFAE